MPRRQFLQEPRAPVAGWLRQGWWNHSISIDLIKRGITTPRGNSPGDGRRNGCSHIDNLQYNRGASHCITIGREIPLCCGLELTHSESHVGISLDQIMFFIQSLLYRVVLCRMFIDQNQIFESTMYFRLTVPWT